MFLSESETAKGTIEEKAIQKYPFHINDKTYFSYECYFDEIIMNGVALSLKESKGISDNPKIVDYLTYSQKLIFYAGKNIMSYNSYKKTYEQIYCTKNVVDIKALSLRNSEKQYILWVQKNQKPQKEMKKEDNIANSFFNFSQNLPFYYRMCLYDMNKKELILKEDFFNPSSYQDIFVFIYPIKAIGFLEVVDKQTIVSFKFIKNQGIFGVQTINEELKIRLPLKIKNLKYNIQANQFLFAHGNTICSFKLCRNPGNLQENNSQLSLLTEDVVNIPQTEGELLYFSVNSFYLVALITNFSKPLKRHHIYDRQENEDINHELRFYSLFSHDFIFSENLSKFIDFTPSPEHLPSMFEISTNTIVLYNERTPMITIWSIYEQNLKFIKEVEMQFDNFCRLEKFFINPYSSEAIVISNHYESEGNFSNLGRKIESRILRAPSLGFKDFYLQISIFHFAVDIAFLPLKKMQLRKRKYYNILCCPWFSQYYLQTQNSIICERWEEKLQYSIKCSAIHPTGQYILLGSNESFKIYFATYEGLQNTYVSEIMKDCISAEYHPSGKQFAVASSNSISIYHCYNYTKLHHINISFSYKTKEIFYDTTGQTLTLITQNRRIHHYKAQVNYHEQFAFNPKAHITAPQKKTLLTSVLSFAKEINSPHNENVNAILYDNDVGVVIFSMNNKIYFISSVNYEALGCFDFDPISCFYLHKPLSTLFIGTMKGDIVCFPWPNKPINIVSKLPTYRCHDTPITKIKITSDNLQLISITEESIFKHEICFISNMRKIQKFQLQKEFHKNSVMILDFFIRKGLCIYSTDLATTKMEKTKQYEEQAMNLNFILPQERQRQRNCMLKNLTEGRSEIETENMNIMLPLKVRTKEFKNNLQKIKGQFGVLAQVYKRKIDEEILSYERKFSELNSEKDKLLCMRNEIIYFLDEKMKEEIKSMKVNETRQRTIRQSKLSQFEKQKNCAKVEAKKEYLNFFQLSQIDEEKMIYKSDKIEKIDEEIVQLKARNGYLISRNTNISKEILVEKRKIQDTKELIESTQRSIIKLLIKRKPKAVKNELANQIFYETEKKYLTETKKSIQKNKAINVSLDLYNKEKNFLVVLEKQLDVTQKSIDSVIEYLTVEKKQKKEASEKCEILQERLKKLFDLQRKYKTVRVKKFNIYKDFKHQVALFIDKVLSLEELRKISKISNRIAQFQTCSALVQSLICNEQKKFKIHKTLNNEEKTFTKIKHDRKIFMKEKKKMYQHNQDLIDNVNTLTHENKYLFNILKTQQQKKQKELRNYDRIKKRKKDNTTCRPTPFENYIHYKKAKSTRRVKTNPCAQYQI